MSSIIISFITIILTIAAASMGLDFNRLCADYSGANNGLWITILLLSIVAFGLLCFSIYTGAAEAGAAESKLKGALSGGKHANTLAFGSLGLLFIVGCLGWNSANRCTKLKNEKHQNKIRSFNQFFVAITTLSLGGIGILVTKMQCEKGQGVLGKLEGAAESSTGGLQIPGL